MVRCPVMVLTVVRYSRPLLKTNIYFRVQMGLVNSSVQISNLVRCIHGNIKCVTVLCFSNVSAEAT